ncbi:peroxiredoxin [Streptomyces mirabilis]|uniref:peroxiredoxin n=1 Tax=Streptomyces mirabilis TaxID=68239 RepID=UPI0036DBDAB3
MPGVAGGLPPLDQGPVREDQAPDGTPGHAGGTSGGERPQIDSGCPGGKRPYRDFGFPGSERPRSVPRAGARRPGPAAPGLPRPPDDGGAAHLPGGRLPGLVLPATDGRAVGLGALGPGRTVLCVYPLSGRPGTDLPDGWDTIPGARGCTAEACAFRNHYDDLRAVGAARVYGLSSQPREYQRELAERLRLPFAILSDTGLALREALDLPTFTAGGRTLYRRLTMIVNRGVIEHVFYPVFPPDQHAAEVLDWLRLQDPPQGEIAHDREGHPLSVPRPPR